MKKIYLAFAAVVALALVACNRTDPYKGAGSFVTFNCNTSMSVREDAGTLVLPIRAIGKHDAFSVTVSGVDGTAKNNTHYKIVEPASGVINFEAADTLKTVTIELIKIDGYVDPGKVEFTVNIDNATSGISRASRRSVAVTVTDADHPLKNFIGAWTAHVVANWGDEYDFNLIVSADDNDITKLWFYNLCAYMGGNGYKGPCFGICSDDLSTITIPKGQSTGYYSDKYGENVVYWGVGDTDIVFVDNGDDTISTTGGWGSHISQGWFQLYPDAVTFTRQ